MLEDKKIPTVLVTGANGQLATEIKKLSSGHPDFHFIFTSRKDLPIEDSRAVESFFQHQRIDYCINCAAYTAVDKAETEREKAFLINAVAVGNLATVCRDYQTQFIHISTDYVYDGTKGTPLKEEDAIGPLNIYGSSKLKGEVLALTNDPSTIVIRTSWVYSAYGANFVKTMLRLFTQKEQVSVVSDQVGSPTYAADLAEVILRFVQRKELGQSFSGVYNYCNSGITNWYEFALAIKEFSKHSCVVLPTTSAAYATPAKRPLYSVLNTAKIKEDLLTDIPFWKDSLQKCLKRLDILPETESA